MRGGAELALQESGAILVAEELAIAHAVAAADRLLGHGGGGAVGVAGPAAGRMMAGMRGGLLRPVR